MRFSTNQQLKRAVFKRKSLPPTPVTPHEYLALLLEISYERQSFAKPEEVKGNQPMYGYIL